MLRIKSDNNLFFHCPQLHFSERREITLTPSNLLFLTNSDLYLPGLIINFPYYMLYNCYEVTSENFVSVPSHHLSAWCCKEIFCLGHSWHGSWMFNELIVSQMLWRGQLIINLNKRKSWKSWIIKKKKKLPLPFSLQWRKSLFHFRGKWSCKLEHWLPRQHLSH